MGVIITWKITLTAKICRAISTVTALCAPVLAAGVGVAAGNPAAQG
jgi:hypothetical protein